MSDIGPSLNYPVMASLELQDVPSDVTEDTLYTMFSGIGELMSVRISRDALGNNTGQAFVTYKDPNHAKVAFDKYNSDESINFPMRILWNRTEDLSMKPSYCNVFIRNIDINVGEKQLYELCIPFGPIAKCRIIRCKYGISCGYGFVFYETKNQAKHAINMLNGKLVNNKALIVEQYRSHNERYLEKVPFNDVYVENFGPGMTEDYLLALFMPFGFVTNCRIICKIADKQKFGFVEYADPKCAAKAVKELNGRILDMTNTMHVCRAHSKPYNMGVNTVFM